MQYGHRQLKSGKWVVSTGKKHFLDSVVDTENEAKILALHYSAHYHQNQMSKIHRELEAMGEINQGDEYGYLA